MNKNNLCVVGGGYWGKNHIKTLSQLKMLHGIVDLDPKNLKLIAEKYPGIKLYKSIEDALKNKNILGYVVATPAETHFAVAKKIISAKKHILVEKPFALKIKDAEELVDLSKRKDVSLMVGHLMLFHPAIVKIKEIIDKGTIGKIRYIYSNRLNLGTFRTDENVFWSFAPHDISLFQYFSESFPSEISSVGGYFLQKNIHDTTITYLKYPNGIQGHIYVSWLHPFKEHRLVIIGSKGSLHFEDSLENKPLLLYEKDSSSRGASINLKNKLPKEIKFDKTTPLENEINCFIKMIKGKSPNKSGINEGIDVVRILETASKSITN